MLYGKKWWKSSFNSFLYNKLRATDLLFGHFNFQLTAKNFGTCPSESTVHSARPPSWATASTTNTPTENTPVNSKPNGFLARSAKAFCLRGRETLPVKNIDFFLFTVNFYICQSLYVGRVGKFRIFSTD
jgi:hypothetical protein